VGQPLNPLKSHLPHLKHVIKETTRSKTLLKLLPPTASSPSYPLPQRVGSFKEVSQKILIHDFGDVAQVVR